jgi:hypothetical protein
MLAAVVFVYLAAAAAAQQRGGDRDRGGVRARSGGGGRGRPVQQKPGKPPEDRFLRVCKVLALEEDQMGKAVKLYQGMIADREKAIGEEQSGELTESDARAEMQKISEHFESEYKGILHDEQRKHLEKLKAEGTLGDEWW